MDVFSQINGGGETEGIQNKTQDRFKYMANRSYNIHILKIWSKVRDDLEK